MSGRGDGRLRAGILGASGRWHSTGLARALAALGHDVVAIPATRLRLAAGGAGGAGVVGERVRVLGPDGVALHELDLLLVRGLPRGSLEQVIFRMDALHVLAAGGVRCVNAPRAIERTIDKAWTSASLAAAGLPTPETVVCERAEDALTACAALDGDIVVKPLFGAMGQGMVRVQDPDVAGRVFRALELERAVYYVQRFVPSPGGRRDLRVLVVGGEVVAAMERVADGWRANVARGARPRAVTLSDDERAFAVAAAAAVGAEIAGVDMLGGDDGSVVVLEVNGIPGWQALQSVCSLDLTAHVAAWCARAVSAQA